VQHSAENTRKHKLQHTLQHNATQKCTIKIGNRGVLAVQQTAAYCYVVQHTATHTATRTETHCSKKMHHQRAITASLQCSTLQQSLAPITANYAKELQDSKQSDTGRLTGSPESRWLPSSSSTLTFFVSFVRL